MTVYQWPADLVPTEGSFDLEHNGARTESPFNNKGQDVVRGGARWRASLVFPARGQADVRKAKAVVSALGYADRVWLTDHSIPTPLGAYAGESCLVAGAASAGASSVLVDRLTANTLNIFKAGDMVQFLNPVAGTSQLVCLTQDVDTDSGGNSIGGVFFTPPLRIALEDNAYVVLSFAGTSLLTEANDDILTEDGETLDTGGLAQAKFMRANPLTSITSGPAFIGSFSVDFIEDVN